MTNDELNKSLKEAEKIENPRVRINSIISILQGAGLGTEVVRKLQEIKQKLNKNAFVMIRCKVCGTEHEKDWVCPACYRNKVIK